MYAPLRFDVCDGSDVVFSGQHKLIIEDPLGFVVEARRGMELNDLIILYR